MTAARAEVDGDRYVIARAGGGWYAVSVAEVIEIMKVPPVTEVPGAGAGVCGVVLVHGAVTTLLDPRDALGEPRSEGDGRARLLTVECEGERLGLRFDEVARILHIAHVQMVPAPAPRHVLGVARGASPEGDADATVLDVASLVEVVLRGSHFS